MTYIKEQPPYRVGQNVSLCVGHDGDTSYYFPMEVTAIDGNELTLARRLAYDPEVLDFHFGKETP